MRLPNIAFIGSIGVGKSTLVEKVKERMSIACAQQYDFIDSVSALVSWKPDPTSAYELALHNCARQSTLEKVFSGKKPIVVDRYFVDRLTWELTWPTAKPSLHADLASTALKYSLRYGPPHTCLFYLPIEFEWGGDDNANRDPHKREYFDTRVRQVLDTLKLRYDIVTGTPTERAKQVINAYEAIIGKETVNGRVS